MSPLDTTRTAIISNGSTPPITFPISPNNLRLGDCSAPAMTLSPSTSSLASPLQYRRNQDFFISSYINLKCNGTLAITAQWTITGCTSVCSTSIVTDPSIVKTFAEIYIPPKTLPYGTYQLKLTVNVALNMTSSAFVYVNIIPSGVVAHLMPYETPMISWGHQQDLTLDPGRYSVDLDDHAFNASVSVVTSRREHLYMCLSCS
jgi:hypothetical protein